MQGMHGNQNYSYMHVWQHYFHYVYAFKYYITLLMTWLSKITWRKLACGIYIECWPPVDDVVCNVESLSMTKGNNVEWNCQFTAAKATTFSLMLNKMTVILPTKPEKAKCRWTSIYCLCQGNTSACLFQQSVQPVRVCCEFNLMASSGTIVKGSKVVVQLMHHPGIDSIDCFGYRNVNIKSHSKTTFVCSNDRSNDHCNWISSLWYLCFVAKQCIYFSTPSVWLSTSKIEQVSLSMAQHALPSSLLYLHYWLVTGDRSWTVEMDLN